MSDLTTTALVPAASDDARRDVLLKAVGWDRLSLEQQELALTIANRYNLDPMLKHLVLIDGRPYITRDGLLHVAHGSGTFDGMETTEPVLMDDGFWRSSCSVYRKDMSRPFTYTGRYPATGGREVNVKYAPEMAIKVGEVMALRRAFDVAAPVIEERWAGVDEDEHAAEAERPATLADRVADRVATVTGTTTPPELVVVPAETAQDAPERPETADDAPDGTDTPVVPDGPTLTEFAELTRDIDHDYVRAFAKRLFPDATKFGDLTPAQLQTVLDAIEADTDPVPPPPAPVDPGPVALCGAESPYGSGATCTQDAGHPETVPHRAGIRETW